MESLSKSCLIRSAWRASVLWSSILQYNDQAIDSELSVV